MKLLRMVVAAATLLAAGHATAHEAAAGPRAQERDSRLGTGHGRHETSHAIHVTFKRVIRDPIHVAPTPRPFPGFVPDPRG